MRPEDVPEFLVEKAEQALMVACDDEPYGICYCPTDDQIRVILAAVDSDIRAQGWATGFYAATDSVPDDVWFDEWTDLNNPYLTEED